MAGVAVPAGTRPDGGVGRRCELQRGRAVPARAKARPVPRGHCSRRAAATGGHGERRANVRRALAGRRRRQAQPARPWRHPHAREAMEGERGAAASSSARRTARAALSRCRTRTRGAVAKLVTMATYRQKYRVLSTGAKYRGVTRGHQGRGRRGGSRRGGGRRRLCSGSRRNRHPPYSHQVQ